MIDDEFDNTEQYSGTSDEAVSGGKNEPGYRCMTRYTDRTFPLHAYKLVRANKRVGSSAEKAVIQVCMQKNQSLKRIRNTPLPELAVDQKGASAAILV